MSPIVLLLGLALQVVIVLSALLLASRKDRLTALGRRLASPRGRRIVRTTRLVLAAGILALLSWGSWQHLRAAYAPQPQVEVRVPTRSVRQRLPDVRKWRQADPPPEGVRLLCYALLAEWTPAGPRVRDVKMHPYVPWPSEPGGEKTHLKGRLRAGPISARYHVAPGGGYWRAVQGGPPVQVRHWNYQVHYRLPGDREGMMSSSLGHPYAGGAAAAVYVLGGTQGPAGTSRLSAVPEVQAERPYVVVLAVRAAADDDPLQAAPAEVLLGDLSTSAVLADPHLDLRRALPFSVVSALEAYSHVHPDVPSGLRLLVRLSPVAIVLLCVAAALLTVRMRPRALAAAGLLLSIALVPVWDRVALGYHADRLRDASAPLPERLIAADRVRQSFFFGRSAEAALREVAEEETAPWRLRRAARWHARLRGAQQWLRDRPEEAEQYRASSSERHDRRTTKYVPQLQAAATACGVQARGENRPMAIVWAQPDGTRWESGSSLYVGPMPLGLLHSQDIPPRRIVLVTEELELRPFGTEADWAAFLRAMLGGDFGRSYGTVAQATADPGRFAVPFWEMPVAQDVVLPALRRYLTERAEADPPDAP